MGYSSFDLPDGYWMLYVLRLEHGYHYIGITTNLKHRLSQHESSKGALVTKQHKPIKLLGVYSVGYMSYEEAEKYEDAFTLAMVIDHGKKWRGGRYCNGCKQKTAEKLYRQIDEKYKYPLDIYSYSYEFKTVARHKKPKRKKGMSKEMRKQIKKAEAQNRAAIRRRFGNIV